MTYVSEFVFASVYVDQVEEKRKYLGGDSEHSVLVKGLDFALLEQTKARVGPADDDDSLEDAFRSASAATYTPKKRTREDIVRELKEKRTKGVISRVEAVPVEEAAKIEKLKKEGKFKPIGFKPIGASTSSKGKEQKDGARKKKKRKIEATTAESNSKTDNAPQASTKPSAQAGSSSAPAKPQSPEPKPVDDDFDIFADAGEYKGIDFDEEDEEESNRRGTLGQEVEKTLAPVQPGKWFVEDEPKPPSRSPSPFANDKGKSKAVEPDTAPTGGPEPEPEGPTRLAPLASSSLPSIRDVLAIDEALEAEEKRRARKEKKKAGGGGGGEEGKKKSAEAKLDRDYQKLKSYQEKKKGG